MKIFVTGASGFVGSAIVKDLLQAGHSVLGLARTNEAAESLRNAGAEVHRGNLDDIASVTEGVKTVDAVIHTAFNHDFTKYKENCEADRAMILALGSALAGTDRPLVITSGIGLMNYGRLLTEDDKPGGADKTPRAASEEAANVLIEQGVNAYIVRLPPTVHGQGDHGFIPMIIELSKAQRSSAYVGEGQNRWPAVHRLDAASLYCLIVELQPAQRVFHAVAEEGIAFKNIAITIGNGLGLETLSMSGKDAETHFGWFLYFASIDSPASNEQSSKTLGWRPQQIELIADLKSGGYF